MSTIQNSVMLIGHLEYREYETKSGEKRRAAEIHLDEMQRL
jgi:single-stranded DNA-binding protein